MSSSEAALPGHREAKVFLYLTLATASLMYAIIFFPHLQSLATPCCYTLPFFLAIVIFVTIRLLRSGTSTAPFYVTLLGVTAIVGGSIFDIVATLIHTPDLQFEANPIARALLDSGHSLMFVFLYAFVSQALAILLLCMLWVAFLRHRGILAASLRGSQSLLVFLKAATGGADLTWRQWVLPFRFSELPHAYYVFWVTAVVVLLACVIDRWYLGLEWFGLVPRIRLQVAIVAITGGVVCFLTWLWYASRPPVAVDQDPPADRPPLL